MNSRTVVNLSEVAKVNSGYMFKSTDWKPEGVPVIKIGNVKAGFVDLAGCSFVDEKVAEQARDYEVRSNDIVIAMTGYVGEVAKVGDIGKALLNQRVGRFSITSPDDLSEDYLFYFLRQASIKEELIARAHGSAQPNLSNSAILSLNITLPAMSEQQSIAEVLGALDDKITTNTKLAVTAERLAAAEFIRHVRHVPLSQLTFGELAKVSGGGTPSTAVSEYWNGDLLWATPTDVTGLQGPYLSTTSRRVSEAGLKSCASELYPEGSILMTSRATIGAFAMAQAPMAVNQGFIVVQPKDPDHRFWFFHEMKSRVEEFVSLANGATFLELSRGNFKKFKVRLAEPHVMTAFAALAEPLHAAAAKALSENAKLASARDLLLPQLMSGRLRVKDAEKILEKAGI